MENLGKLIDAGMNVARLNFSHGDHETHAATLDRLREARACMELCICVYWMYRRPLSLWVETGSHASPSSYSPFTAQQQNNQNHNTHTPSQPQPHFPPPPPS